jgi:RNAse (barnase) inhibitor barstar
MGDVTRRLLNARRGGVYRVTRPPTDLERSARAAGLSFHRIDLGGAAGKADLLGRVAAALRFPAHFGSNWDALHDCLTDLSWLGDRGWVLVFDTSQEFATGSRDDFDTAVEVLRRAAEYWRDQGTPFWVFFSGPEDRRSGLREFR